MSHQGVKHERHHSGSAILQCARQARARTTIRAREYHAWNRGMMHAWKNDARICIIPSTSVINHTNPGT